MYIHFFGRTGLDGVSLARVSEWLIWDPTFGMHTLSWHWLGSLFISYRTL